MSEKKLEQKFIYIFKEDNPQNKFERYLCQPAKIERRGYLFKCPVLNSISNVYEEKGNKTHSNSRNQL